MSALRYTVLTLGILAIFQEPVWAIDHVVFERGEKRIHVSGKVVVEAADGGLLVQARNGVLWAVQSDELVEQQSSTMPFEALDAKQLAEGLLAEMPDGFSVRTTAHYVVVYNTSKSYAQWCGALFERLYRAFHNYWKRRGLELHPPEGPLVALVFEDKISYTRYAQGDLEGRIDSVIGYYNLRTNRVTMYDLTGIAALRSSARGQLSTEQINVLLGRPEVERTVATIVHEATHQIAFNCGLHQRYADIPLWLSEGIAMYFETPDLKSARGWRNVGGVNRVRLREFRALLPLRAPDSLTTLVTDDTRFRNTEKAKFAYPDSWAMVYYLMRNRPKQFIQYLRGLAKKKPLVEVEGAQRLDDFKTAFGEDLENLEEDFLRQMNRVR